jgi:hypothetical protein
MWRRRSTIAGLLLASVTLSACDMHTSVKGRVRGAEGQPQPGASVELAKVGSDRVERQRTDAEGYFTMGRTHGRRCPGFVVSVALEGFKPETAKLECNGMYSCEVALAADSESRPSRIACTLIGRP